MSAVCTVCPHHCSLKDGQSGLCRARENRQGKIVCSSYGRITSLALDPIEKKPLYRFHPGSKILSVGSYGCNMRCAFCQNHGISMADGESVPWTYVAAEELAAKAIQLKDRGSIGIAFTYNEPCIGFEYVRDVSIPAREAGLKTVLVTNGCVSEQTAEELIPYIDAMNIDLKAFTAEFYQRHGGDLETVKRFIKKAAVRCHVELTMLLVPGENDDADSFDEMIDWIASLDPEIPLHVSRFFPQWRMLDRAATPVDLVYEFAGRAKTKLKHVYTGNC